MSAYFQEQALFDCFQQICESPYVACNSRTDTLLIFIVVFIFDAVETTVHENLSVPDPNAQAEAEDTAQVGGSEQEG